MKKILILLILILSFVFMSGCDMPDSFFKENDTGGSTLHSEHTDEDDNGRCDLCALSVITVFDFYAINDLHGKLSDTNSQPGVDELTTYLKDAKQNNSNTVILSSGDMWQGTSESNLTGGLIITDWMNEVGFVSMTMGNHEYDWGEEYIESNAKQAEFPFLAINIYDTETNERVSYCESSVVLEYDGIQIGIIGAIGDCYSSISKDKVEDVYFLVGDELTELVKAESKRLRDSGVDIIVYSLHDGYGSSKKSTTSVSGNQISSYYDIELSQGNYVDLVFEAHTHQRYVLKDTYGVYHLQGGGENKYISKVELYYNYVNSSYTVNTATTISNSVYSSSASDDSVDALLEKYADILAKGNELLGNNIKKRDSDEIKSITSALYYKLGIEAWGDEYDIALGGGYISVRSPYSLYEGEVIYADIQSLLPFDNAIVLCSIKGKDLKNRFFETDNENYYITYGEYGANLRGNIDYNATYYIVTDTYSAYYAPNNLAIVEVFDENIFARDLMADYIKSGGLEK